MERRILERRSVLKGGMAAAGMLGSGASTATVAGVKQAAADAAQSPLPEQILSALERFRSTIPANFDREYVEKAVIPFFLTSLYEGERPMLPMIGVNFSKENALPYDLWGLIYHDWKPTPEEGVTVFLQGLEKRGDNNLRKRIYFSAVTRAEPTIRGTRLCEHANLFQSRLNRTSDCRWRPTSGGLMNEFSQLCKSSRRAALQLATSLARTRVNS